MKYDPKSIEKKWQKFWKEKKLFATPKDATRENKMYILPQLPYPSGSGLHVGHAEVYTACDIYARYQRMQGKKVLQVMGWDAFGLPAENYAIKTNVHPRTSTNDAINNFRKQITSLGISVDWEREVGSHNPDYYKWTQWFFLLFYKRGLAYRKKQAVNWCDDCKTVLANEQVVDGKCERSGTVVVQRDMEQWYLKITEYADRLLEGLNRIDWPEETKKRQRDWIGRSEGINITYQVSDAKETIVCFTTTPVNWGATFIVVAPEHPIISKITKPEYQDQVSKYLEDSKRKTELERQVDDKTKTGVFTGSYAINHLNGEKIPIWVADFVLVTFGTGAVQGCPAHDARDFEFAKKYNLPIIRVVEGKNGETAKFVDPEKEEVDQVKAHAGIKRKMINSDIFNGLTFDEGMEKTKDYFEEKGWGKRVVNYKLRDWSVSRQRFWGAPIPMLVNESERQKKRQYVFIHGRSGTAQGVFWPWLKKEIEARGHTVVALDLPDADFPDATAQAAYILEQASLDEDTVIVAHSHGGPVAFRLLEKLKQTIAKLVLVDTVLKSDFNDGVNREFRDAGKFKFDFSKISHCPKETVIIADRNYPIIRKENIDEQVRLFDARLVLSTSEAAHFTGQKEAVILEESIVYGILPLSVKDLPVTLPDDVDFKPTGESPLNYSKDFNKGVEEKYGQGWRREPDTLDTFMCSSWYYYRYLDPKNDKAFASPESLKDWMPVDFYLGGAEHVNGHLLYSRFFTKVLYDAGYIDFDEPFLKHRHQGTILGEDSRKMSKRWNNVINPTDVVNEFGADTCRTYEMFMGPLEDTKPWDTNGVKGVRRFLERVWALQDKVVQETKKTTDYRLQTTADTSAGAVDRSQSTVVSLLHQTIKKVTKDVEVMKFNTAIAALMILTNEMMKQEKISNIQYQILTKLLSPFAPHLCEELWEIYGDKELLTYSAWPQFDAELAKESMITIVVQVNGKVREQFDVPAEISEDEVKKLALASEKVQKWLDGKAPKKVIYVKGKLVSIVA